MRSKPGWADAVRRVTGARLKGIATAARGGADALLRYVGRFAKRPKLGLPIRDLARAMPSVVPSLAKTVAAIVPKQRKKRAAKCVDKRRRRAKRKARQDAPISAAEQAEILTMFQNLGFDISPAVAAQSAATSADNGKCTESGDGPIADHRRLLSSDAPWVTATMQFSDGTTDSVLVRPVVSGSADDTSDATATAAPGGIQVRRNPKRVEQAHRVSDAFGKQVADLYAAAKDGWKRVVMRNLRHWLRADTDRRHAKRQRPTEAVFNRWQSSPIVAPLGPGARILAIGGAARTERVRIAEACRTEPPETVADLLHGFLHIYEPAVVRGHHAARSSVIHIPGGMQPGAKQLTEEGAYIQAIMQLTVLGIDPETTPWLLVEHTDKPGRTDYHILVARHGANGSWQMDSLHQAHLAVLAQNMLAASAGLGEEHMIEAPFGTSAIARQAQACMERGRGRDNKALCATIVDPTTGKAKEKIPLVGQKAARRWAAVLHGMWLDAHDCLCVWKVAKGGLAAMDAKSLTEYVCRVPVGYGRIGVASA